METDQERAPATETVKVPRRLAWIFARILDLDDRGFTGRVEVIFRKDRQPAIETHEHEEPPANARE